MLTDNYIFFCEILETVSLFETYRSGHPEVFCKSGDLYNCESFTGKHLLWNPILVPLNEAKPSTFTIKRYS